MRIGPETTLRQLAFIVGDALNRKGITAVLSGGGAATVYAPKANSSRDLDFIFSYHSALGNPSAESLLELGFRRHGSGYYEHPLSPFTLEFPAGPLAVGDEVITTWETLTEGGLCLHILTPTDCVRDRLAWFLFNRDFSALSQAVAVAGAQAINLEAVKSWCDREGESAKFNAFLARLGGS